MELSVQLCSGSPVPAARRGGGQLFVVALSPCARQIVEVTRLQKVLGERDVRDVPAA